MARETASMAEDGEQSQSVPSAAVRYAVVAATVAGVIALGFLFNTDADAYLVMGIPITAAFQLLVARRPLRALWVRAAPAFRLDRIGVLLALLLAIAPAVIAVQAFREEEGWRVVYGIAGACGAVPAAYAIRAMNGTTVRQLGLCLATAGVIGVIFDLSSAIGQAHLDRRAVLAEASGVHGIESFLLYLPVIFLMEEVFFRGALDSYLHRSDEGTGWLSAFYLSALWGLWHLPIYYDEKGLAVIPSLLLVQICVGVPLSIWWRRSGNLTVTGTTHAFIDAVRNAFVGAP